MEDDDSPLQFLTMDDDDDRDDGGDDDDIDEDAIIEETEMFRMNLHDTVVSSRGLNPLMSYIVDAEEQTPNRSANRPRNSSARH